MTTVARAMLVAAALVSATAAPAAAADPLARLEWLGGAWDCGGGSVFTYALDSSQSAIVMHNDASGLPAASFAYENGRYVYRSILPTDPYIATLPGAASLPHLVSKSYTNGPSDFGSDFIRVSGPVTPSSNEQTRLVFKRTGDTLKLQVASREKSGPWQDAPPLSCKRVPFANALRATAAPAAPNSDLQEARDRCLTLLEKKAFAKAEPACDNFAQLLALTFGALKEYGEPKNGTVAGARTIPITRGLAESTFLQTQAYRGGNQSGSARQTAKQSAAFALWLSEAVDRLDPHHADPAYRDALAYAAKVQSTVAQWYPGIMDEVRKLPKPQVY